MMELVLRGGASWERGEDEKSYLYFIPNLVKTSCYNNR